MCFVPNKINGFSFYTFIINMLDEYKAKKKNMYVEDHHSSSVIDCWIKSTHPCASWQECWDSEFLCKAAHYQDQNTTPITTCCFLGWARSGPVLTMCLKIIDVISYVGDKCLNNVLQIDIDNLWMLLKNEWHMSLVS